MQKIRPLLALGAALLVTGCAPDSEQLVEPAQPLRSDWTRTYSVSGQTYEHFGLGNNQPVSYAAGYLVVELVADVGGSASQVGIVWGEFDDAQSFYKPSGYSLRLTAVSTQSNCDFWRWVLSTPTGTTTTTGSSSQINMDDARPYSIVRGDFLCR